MGILLATLLAACSAAGGAGASDEPKQARGLLVNMSAVSITQLKTIEVRTEAGQILTFDVEGDIGFTPGHTREHMLQAQPVTVTYRQAGDGLVAVKIED